MGTTRDVIRKEIDQKLLSAEGQHIIEFLPLDERKGTDMYFKGPPEMVYVQLPSGASMRIGLIETGILSNEMLINPSNFRIKVDGPYYKLPRDQREIVTYGELVKVEDTVKSKKDMEPIISNPIMGHFDASQIVKSIEIGNSSIKVGEKGDIQLMSKGEVIKTFTDIVEITKKPEDTTVMFGGDKKTLFKNSFLGEILPKSFFPPMNTPNWLINSEIFERASTILNEAINIAEALKATLK